MKQKTTITDFFKNYPYKNKDTEGTGGIFYIPKYEIISNHKFSITRRQYLEITKQFFNVLLFEYLIWGNTYKAPHNFGNFTFKKCKNNKSKKKNIDFNETRKLYGEYNKLNPDNKKVIYHKNYHTQGYGVYIKWDKKESYFSNKYSMFFSLAKRQEWILAKALKTNPQIINYLNE